MNPLACACPRNHTHSKATYRAVSARAQTGSFMRQSVKLLHEIYQKMSFCLRLLSNQQVYKISGRGYG